MLLYQFSEMIYVHVCQWSQGEKFTQHHSTNIYLREKSPVTQTTLEPTLLTWERWPREKYSSHPRPHSETRSNRAYHATQTPLFSNPLMLPFDTQVCQERQNCLRFHWILKVILEMAFSVHCISILKLNRISRTSISKVVQKYIWCCGRVQRCVTAPRWVMTTVQRVICFWT